MSAGPLSRIGAAFALCAALLGRGAEAQGSSPWDFRAPGLSRRLLEEMQARYEAAAESPAYSQVLRARARADVESVRTRLRDGDLRVGDRLRLTVEGQAQLTDTFVVASGPAVVLPGIGSVALVGVLRSEVEAHLAQSVDRVYRGAVVRARMLIRVSVVGGVGRPGFYALSSEALVDDAIMAAGGPGPDALLLGVYVGRGRDRVWLPDSLQVAMRAARTIAELGVQDGDRIVVPRQGPRDLERLIRTIGLAVSLPFTILALRQLF